MTKQKKIYAAVVTEQALANLLPLLQFGADRVALAASEEMQRQAQDFKILICRKLKRLPEDAVEIREGLPSAGLSAISDWGFSWLEDLQERFPGAPVVLNITGGTKLMSLGLREAAVLFDDVRLVYTDTAHDQLEWLGRNPPDPLPLADLLDVDACLMAMGRTPRRALSDDESTRAEMVERKPLTKWLAQHAGELDGLFRNLCRVLAEEPSKPGPHSIGRVWGLRAEALQKLADAGVVDLQDDSQFYLQKGEGGEESRRYLMGQWLEEYVWHVLRDEGLGDVRLGLDITEDRSRKDDVRNELDVVAVHRNRLLLCECKVRFLRSDDSVSDMIYKLDSVSAGAGGTFVLPWLVNAGSFGDAENRKRQIARALEKGISVVTAEQLRDLPKRVREWKSAARLERFPLS